MLTEMTDASFFLKTYYLFMYLFTLFLAASGLSCGMRDLSLWRTGSSLWCAGFTLVVVHSLQGAWAL